MVSADGDQPLEPRQEDYCRRRARGESQAKAYVGAGYKAGPNGAAGRLGWRLEKRPSIKARIAALREIVGEAKLPMLVPGSTMSVYGFKRRVPDKEYVLDGLVEIAERCMQHHVLTDAQGAPIKVPGPDGEMCLLVGFRPKEATRAYELLGKELGMFVERLDATHRFEERYRTMTQAERMADAEALADEVRRLLGRQEQDRLEAEAIDAETVEVEDDPVGDAPDQPADDDIQPEMGETPGNQASAAEPTQPRGSSWAEWRRSKPGGFGNRTPSAEAAAPSKPSGLGALGLGVPDPRPNGGSDGGSIPDRQSQVPDTEDETA